ncbi:hypothetical protein ACFSJQ_18230 [Vibrio olivae]|uniref:Oxidoreductase n=1 Tax=Vibrio olivae TaxID=1243002 RepID=A0ABV5HNC5_9VIBR
MKWIATLALFLNTMANASMFSVTVGEKTQQLSIEQLEVLFPSENISTTLPWYTGSRTFTGIRLLDLLHYLDVTPDEGVSFHALNDYTSYTSWQDIQDYNPYLVFKMNGQYMRIRDKGPLWFIYDLATYPQLDTADYRQQMTWQISGLTIK